MSFNPSEHPHRRLNLLSGKWILCSPHRASRPWQGQVEKKTIEELPSYDPTCYLCPGNKRATGDANPAYQDTFTFTNDFSALLQNSPTGEINEGDGLLRSKGTNGLCRVICFSPNHSLTVAEMDQPQVRKVIDEWVFQYDDLTKNHKYKYAQIFENKGAIMGCSNPHPHGQVWAGDQIPEDVTEEIRSFQKWKQEGVEKGKPKEKCCLLCEYVALELEKKTRIVCENESFVVLVPYWAYWPFEVMVLPKKHVSRLSELNDKEKDSLASILRSITVKYDNVFETSFPYSMGIHQAPVVEGEDHSFFHMHFHFYPPLLRSAAVKKFLVGYEMLADLCRDIPAEASAEKLRGLPEVHWKIQAKQSSS